MTTDATMSSHTTAAPLTMAAQGSFAVGGIVVTRDGTFDPRDPMNPVAQTLHGDHARVSFQVPADARRLPLLFWHGWWSDSSCWYTTPDGREGFRTLFLRRGFGVYVLDRPRRGSAGKTTTAVEISTEPNEQWFFNQFRLGVWHDLYDRGQFSSDPATRHVPRKPPAGSHRPARADRRAVADDRRKRRRHPVHERRGAPEGHRYRDQGAVHDRGRTAHRDLLGRPVRGRRARQADRIRHAGVDRSEVLIETKVWISDYGYDEALHAFDKCAGKFGVERIDLLLLHQPIPTQFDRTVQAYRALERLLADGRARAIGVSNFMPDHLAALLERSGVVPALNQVEVHPYFSQPDVQYANAEHHILTQAWSPMGGITSYRGTGHSTFDDPVIAAIATEHAKTPAQVMLRWHLQEGRSAIPKSVHPARIAASFDVFDFELTHDQLAAFDELDTGVRRGPEPESVTPEAFGREIPEP